ncbi:MAG: hypothetical protein EXQ79_09770 [Acidimicrobiia bacterium]|nr:hypothetical protein [Acidimicrobiia bacterium]
MRKKTQSRAARAWQLFSESTQESVLAFTLGGLLIGFVLVVVREVVATLGGSSGYQSDEYELFAVSLTGLVGGVFAVAMRRDQRAAPLTAPDDARIRRVMGTAFAFTYILAGVVAIAVCLMKLSDSTSLLRSLAATFLGTSVAAASAVFGTQISPAKDPPPA